MATDAGPAEMPRWGGVTEPMTVLTNVVLAALALWLAARLGYGAAAGGVGAGVAMSAALMATSVAALLGAVAHGIDPVVAPRRRALFWRAALHATGLVGAATIVSVAYFAASGSARTAILAFAAVKLAMYTRAVARRPTFQVAALDYGSALAVLLAGAVYALVRWRAPGTGWIIGGVAVSLVAGVVQARRLAPHRQFNHNDLYHVIQMVGLYLFYRGGALLADR